MVTLTSPGVSVQIIDESFYGGAGLGTIPLIVLATGTNKTSPSGSGIAPATVPNQAGALFLATSQRELIQNFGTPSFKTVQGTPVQGYELNEYGLLAAYQYLGISNRCYILRANIDLNQLNPAVSPPVTTVPSGTYWLDLSSTSFGIFQSNGNQNTGLSWVTQPTLLFSNSNLSNDPTLIDFPASNFGTDGDFTIVTTSSDNILYERINGSWYKVGSIDWKAQRPTTIIGSVSPNNIDPLVDLISINTVTVAFDQIPDGQGGFTTGTGALIEIVTAINAASIPNIVASISNSNALEIKNTAGELISINDISGTPLTTLGITAKTYVGVDLYQTNSAQYPSNSARGSVWIKGSYPNKGAKWTVKRFNSSTGWTTLNAPFHPFDSLLNDGNPAKDRAATIAFGNPAMGTIYVGYDVSNGTQQLRRWTGTLWTNLIYEASIIEPYDDPSAGTYWYNSDFKADIMYGDGTQWLGYSRKFTGTDPNGVIISGSKPMAQSNGNPLVDHDLWIDSSDTENYPMLYRYSGSTTKWELIDKTDDTSPFGIVFADARENSGTNYTNNNGTNYDYNSKLAKDLVLSNFVDPDAPEPRAYPDGMLLFNTRASTYNVKEWNPTYFEAGNYSSTDYTMQTYTSGGSLAVFPRILQPGRWVTASGNSTDGSPYMGRKAQRIMIVRAMESVIQNNEDIRSELVYFNLIASPGYPELIPQMVALNTTMLNVAFVVGDTPIRLEPGGTPISNWAKNAKNVTATGEDGLIAPGVQGNYVGLYYPWGLSTDLSGNEVMMPPSAIALGAIAYNDQVSYPWFAPAGFTRGLVTNATTVGYLDSGNNYQPVILNQGQRDNLYINNINPIAYIVGRGLVVYGQKTLQAGSTSAMSRINVARLVNYLSYNLDNILKPFLFEQNDAQTQSAVSVVVTNFLNGLVSLQGVADYAVICDSSNNTAARVSANQLWVDIAIIPVNAIEFIYIPVRILNTGQSLESNVSATVQL